MSIFLQDFLYQTGIIYKGFCSSHVAVCNNVFHSEDFGCAELFQEKTKYTIESLALNNITEKLM